MAVTTLGAYVQSTRIKGLLLHVCRYDVKYRYSVYLKPFSGTVKGICRILTFFCSFNVMNVEDVNSPAIKVKLIDSFRQTTKALREKQIIVR